MSIFSSIMTKRPRSSAFNLSHTRKLAFNPGRMIPSLCQEVLPSDRWSVNTSAMVRFQPLLAPLMHLVDVYNYSFFVPCRLTMERNKFEVFITGGQNGDGKDAQGNTIDIPYIVFNKKAAGTSSAASISWNKISGPGPDESGVQLADFLGVGFAEGPLTSESETFRINAMPFIAFWKIWNEYFRDQNLHLDIVGKYPGIFESRGDITSAVYTALSAADPNHFDLFGVPQVCWEKDYFTSALPFAQKGSPVETPLSGEATVTYRNQAKWLVDGIPNVNAGSNQYLFMQNGTPNIQTGATFGTPSSGAKGIDNIESVELESGGFTINQLRLSARLQEWLEKMARGGSRYIEQIRAHFGVTSSDARLQRPEFIGGGKIPVHISEVLQTSETGTQPLADMAGHGIAAGNTNGFSRFFEEHGFVISIMFLRPRTAYQNGMPRMFTQRFDKLDWAWPSFAHLGEQEVKQGELAYTGSSLTDDDTFGYQSRYAEYKYIPNTVHGAFKGSLDFWHWGRKMDPDVALNKTFVECDPDPRIFNVVDAGASSLYAIVNNRVTAVRPLPYFSQPTL